MHRGRMGLLLVCVFFSLHTFLFAADEEDDEDSISIESTHLDERNGFEDEDEGQEYWFMPEIYPSDDPVFTVADDEEDEEDEEDSGYVESIPIDDWDGFLPDKYSTGDQTFTITAGTVFPLFFLNNGTQIDHNLTPPVGGTGSLSYNFFINANLFFGAEVGFTFNSTLRNHMVYLIPIGLRAGWQFVARRMEFPLYAVFGIAPVRYNTNSYLGFFLKGGVGIYYRLNPDWSFGLNTDWNWYPQRPLDRNRNPDREKNVDANILGLTISARYHF